MIPRQPSRLLVFAAVLMALTIVGGCKGPIKVEGCVTAFMPTDNTVSPVYATRVPRSGGGSCDEAVALIDVDGLLVNRNLTGFNSLGENPVGLFREKLNAAAADPCIRAIVLRINSPGGGVTASDIMRHDLVQFKARTGLPVVACLMDVGAGGAYYLATAADVVIAHPTTITGGIGVILNMYDLVDALEQNNIVPVPIKAGINIDMGSPIRRLPPADEMDVDQREDQARALLQQIADQYHRRFRDTVAASRPLEPARRDEVFDGRIFVAAEALSLHLVDGIGYLHEAIETAGKMGNVQAGGGLVMFRRTNDSALSRYDITSNIPTQNSLFPISIPGFDRSTLPTFLYLWQPEPLLEKTGGN